MIRKIILSVLIGLLLTSTSIFAKDWSKIRIGTEGAYPPFNYTDNSGEVKGFDIDIATALCKEMGAKCTIVTQDWDGIIPALLARKYDAIVASMSITEERLKKVDFTGKYYATPARFVAKKGKYGKRFKPNKKKLGTQRSTIFQNFLEDNFPKAKIKLYDTIEQALLDLQSGRLDAVMSDGLQLQDGFLKSDKGDGYELVGKAYYDKKWFGEGIGIAVRKQDKDLTEAFNQAIKAIRKKGIYQEISNRYFGYDVYGK